GKESRIRQERKSGFVEKPARYHRDRFPIVMRVIAIVLIVALITWGSLFAVKSATGTIAYQVGSEKVLQADITARVQNYIDMYKQYGMDLTSAQYASTLESVRQNVIDSSIEQELFVQYAKSKNTKIDEAKLKTALDTEVENAVTQSKTQFGTDTKAFEDAVVAQYGSLDKFKATLRTQIQPYVEQQQLADSVTAEINAGVTVSDADVKAYFASQGRVNADHLLITVDTTKDSSSTIAAKKKVAQTIYDDIVKQEAENATFDFAKYAKEKAAELNKKTAGYATYEALGFFTSGQMVKEFETAAFAAKAGDIVGPVQTSFGFHIIHKIAQEPISATYDTAETVKAAHVVLGFGTGDQTAGAKAAETLANKIYAELQKGLSFKTAVTKYSTDADAKTGGILDYFSAVGDATRFGAVKGLKVGEYSKPFVDGSSYEIVQVLGRKPFVKATLSDKATYDKVKTALEDERKADAKTALVAKLKEQFPVREGQWSRITKWYGRGLGKVLGAVGQWIVKATGKGTTTTPATDVPTTPSAE
ncbi:MAG TPA: peptidylprolyl isomerase, partial [Clostridia bacterium]|nr:peptidylprolyl isomerase [Clostridia bacterium]